jgi:CRP-like cAMP-binding protein
MSAPVTERPVRCLAGQADSIRGHDVELRLRVRPDPKAGRAGFRRTETVERVMGRARRLTEQHPSWALSDLDFTHTLTVSGSSARLGPGDFLPVYEINYDGNVPGSAAKQFADSFARWLDDTVAVRQRGSDAKAHELLRAIERLAHDLNTALESNGQLRRELEAANMEVDFLRRQVQQLTEALSSNRPSIAKAMLAALGAILLAVATGMAEGAAGPLLADEEQPTTTVFVQQCDMLVNQFDEIDFPNDRWPGAT